MTTKKNMIDCYNSLASKILGPQSIPEAPLFWSTKLANSVTLYSDKRTIRCAGKGAHSLEYNVYSLIDNTNKQAILQKRASYVL